MSKTKVKIVNNCCSTSSFVYGLILGILAAAIITVVLKKKKGIDISQLLSTAFEGILGTNNKK
jgi:Flp pilus assembly pilin Flp